MKDKRSYQRHKVSLEAKCKPAGSGDEAYSPVTVTDVVPGTIAFLSGSSLNAGSKIEIKIFLYTNDIVHFQTEIIRSDFLRENNSHKIVGKIIEGSESDKNMLIRLYAMNVLKKK